MFFYLSLLTQIHCPYPEKNFCSGNFAVGVKLRKNEVPKNGRVNEFVGSIKKFNIMKRKKEENEKLIDNIKTHVRRVLMKQGKYSPEMSYQIELLASDLLVFRKIRNMVLDLSLIHI